MGDFQSNLHKQYPDFLSERSSEQLSTLKRDRSTAKLKESGWLLIF